MKKIQLLIALIICCAGIAVASSFYPVPPAPVITSSKGATLCSGDSTVLTATSAGATNYLWSTGATTQSITVTASGTYTATASNASGNSAPGQISIDAISYAQDTIQWQKCPGGSYRDQANAVKKTSDGGYVVAGYSRSTDGDVIGNHGGDDYWIVKFDSSNIIKWKKSLGGNGNDIAYSIQQTSDTGYIIAGYTRSNNGNVSGNHGGDDYWVVKLDKKGVLQWQKCLGGSTDDGANSIQQTSDGGYIVAGYILSNDGNVSGNHGYTDGWIVKLDSIGIIQWQKCLGGSNHDGATSIQQASDGGYIVAGYTNSNDGNVSGKHLKNDYWIVKLDDIGNIQWQKCLGGSEDDGASSIQKTSDGGYIVAGNTSSSHGDVSGNHGGADYWIVKLDSIGIIQWQKCLGGSSDDYANSIQQTSDGGYIVAGNATSSDGDVSGYHGSVDYWIVKIDSGGSIKWQKCFGGSGVDYASSIQQTSGGAYIAAGYTYSNDGDVLGNQGWDDYWIIKLGDMVSCPAPVSGFKTTMKRATSVNVHWNTVPCAEQYTIGFRVTGTSTWSWKITNGNIGDDTLTGLTPSTDYDWYVNSVCDISSNSSSTNSPIQHFTTPALPAIISSKGTLICEGDITVLTIKTAGAINYLWSTGATTQSISVGGGTYTATASNATETFAPIQITIDALITPSYTQWQRSLGGNMEDQANSIQQTSDGGYIVAGYTGSNNGNVSGNHGSNDYWVVKLNSLRVIEWQKCLGGSSGDYASSIQQTSDGGYIVAGYTASYHGNVSGNHGSNDYWIVKLSGSGSIQWQKCLGGSKADGASSIQQTPDGGYIVAGYTNSQDGDVSGKHGSYDYWIVKLDSLGIIQWQKCLGGNGDDYANSIKQTSDGGFIVAGYTYSINGNVSGNHGSSDYWVVKLSGSGAIQWQKCLGGSSGDVANSIQQTSDGGYIVAGSSASADGDVTGNNGGGDYWIVKLDNIGIIQWQRCLGGSNVDNATSAQQTPDGGYIVAGNTNSNDGEVSGNHGGYDCWVVKLDNDGNFKWQKCFGGSSVDGANSIQQTSDGGYVVAGKSNSNDGDVSGNHGSYDYWIVKLAPDGSCPVPSTGFNTSDITTTSAKVNWDIIQCAEYYKLRYRVTGTTNWISTKTFTNAGYKLLNGLAPSTNYDWQVRTVCDDASNSISNFSAIQHFTTAPLREGDTYSISNCTVFPNPTKGNFTLSFISDDNLKGSIEIYNTIGGLVIHRSIEMSEGDNSTELDLSIAPTGIYFLNIKTANGVYRQKLVKE